MRMLMQHGADPTATGRLGCSLLHEMLFTSASQPVVNALELLPSLPAACARIVDSSGRTALHLTAACMALFPNAESDAADAEHTAGSAEPAAASAPAATAAEPAAPASVAWHLYRALQQRGASNESRDADGCTPLLYALPLHLSRWPKLPPGQFSVARWLRCMQLLGCNRRG
jgi:hypothetical protein